MGHPRSGLDTPLDRTGRCQESPQRGRDRATQLGALRTPARGLPVAAKEKGDYRGKRLAMFVVVRLVGSTVRCGYRMVVEYASQYRGLWTII